ncbi:hypothetical protein HYV22_00930 [Candidatus Gottesmanbacteria bacterium]|nr:hypothetical protein [Candidatus Gottesmanbacteria bacterium]
MDDRRKTLTAVAIIIGFVVLVVVIVASVLSRKKIISPVPEDNAIKIIFITPTPPPAGGSGQVPATPSASPKPTKNPS